MTIKKTKSPRKPTQKKLAPKKLLQPVQSLAEAVASGFRVYDDVFSKNEMDEIEEYVLFSEKLKWIYSRGTINPNIRNRKQQKEFSFFGYPFMRDGKKMSPLLKFPVDILNKFCKKVGLHYDEMIRVQANLTTMQASKLPSPARVDLWYQHYVVVYYVDDSDGDTVFFKNRTSGEITGRVSPKKGRFLLFDGKSIHGYVPPNKHSRRAVLNYNIL